VRRFGTAACVCILACLGVWVPLGISSTLYRYVDVCDKKSDTIYEDQSLNNRMSDAIIFPSTQELVVKAIGWRKWSLTCYVLLCVLFLGLFLGLATSVSMITDALAETQRDLRLAVHGARVGNGTLLTGMVLRALGAACRLVSLTYIAQVFYVDMGVVSISSVWHGDMSDAHDVSEARSNELEEIANVLERVERKVMESQASSNPKQQITAAI